MKITQNKDETINIDPINIGYDDILSCDTELTSVDFIQNALESLTPESREFLLKLLEEKRDQV